MKRVAVIGCGSIAKVHAQVLKVLESAEAVQIVSFVDILRERAEEFSEKYTQGQATVYDNINDLFENEQIDVIHICTPHYLHVPMAIEAMRHKVSFFSEKPPAVSMEQFEEMCRVYEENSELRAGFCFQNRYNGTIKKADEILQSGEIGNVTGARAFVNWRRDENYYQTEWKGKLATEGGGALINQSIHTLDLMLKYLGKPLMTKATLSNHHLQGVIEVEDTVEAWMTFEGEKRACFYATTAYATDAPVILELQCERGSITIIDKNLFVMSNGEMKSYSIDEEKGLGKGYWGNGHLSCIRDFYEKMDLGERFMNDLDGVRITMETMMEIYKYREI